MLRFPTTVSVNRTSEPLRYQLPRTFESAIRPLDIDHCKEIIHSPKLRLSDLSLSLPGTFNSLKEGEHIMIRQSRFWTATPDVDAYDQTTQRPIGTTADA